MVEDRKPWIVTIPTPEGEAYYPFGSWGRGYIVDPPTRLGLEKALRRWIWTAPLLFSLPTLISRRLGFNDDFIALGGLLVAIIVGIGGTVFLLRNCVIAQTRVTSNDILRRTIAQRGYGTVEAILWCGLVVFTGVTALNAFFATGIAHLVFVTLGLAFVGSIILQLYRIKRLDIG